MRIDGTRIVSDEKAVDQCRRIPNFISGSCLVPAGFGQTVSVNTTVPLERYAGPFFREYWKKVHIA